MANITEEIRLILVEVGQNSNKWWTGRLYDNGDCETLWGRVGYSGDSKRFPNAGQAFLYKKRREKEKKGYTELRTIVGNKTQVIESSVTELRKIAKEQIIQSSNPVLDKLIERLVKSNVHKILNTTQIQFNSSTGLFTTPLGVVTVDAINDARNLLVSLDQRVSKRDWSSSIMVKLTNEYLRLVPQAVGMRLNIESLFPDRAAIQKQSDVLDSLEASYQALQSSTSESLASSAPVFKVRMDILHDSKEESRLLDWFEKSKKDIHNYGKVKVTQIFVVDIESMTNSYENNLTPHNEVFHGTSQANCLSILKNGLKVNPPSTAAIAGKMFGNGIYGAINSSKSLGYTFGRWGQGGVGESGWLFICDFAMGKIHTAHSSCQRPAGCDSVWAKAGRSLYNDELIVYRNSQVKIKYLMECK